MRLLRLSVSHVPTFNLLYLNDLCNYLQIESDIPKRLFIHALSYLTLSYCTFLGRLLSS